MGMDSTSVEAYIDRVGKVLGESGELRDPAAGRTLKEVYSQDYCDQDGEPQTPFMRLPSTYLDIAIDGFRSQHRIWLIRLLTEFAPYKQLMDYARTNNLIEGIFGKWHAQTKKHRGTLKDDFNTKDPNWYKREILDHVVAIESMKGAKDDADWSFKAIFQKALVRLARSIAFDNQADADRLGNIDTIIEIFDALHAKGVLRVRAKLEGHNYGLWTFIGTNPGNQKIKVTAKVESNILALLRLWYYANRKILLDRADAIEADVSAYVVEPRKLIAHFEAKKNVANWPEAEDSVKSLQQAIASTVLFKSLNIQEDEGDPAGEDRSRIQKQRNDAVMNRLVAIVASGIVV